jgi:hypothetical protein
MKEGDVVYTAPEDIEQLLTNLDSSVPRLLRENHGIEFWIEYLQRADEIKERVSLDNYDWVTTRIDEIPIKHGALPPSMWVFG